VLTLLVNTLQPDTTMYRVPNMRLPSVVIQWCYTIQDVLTKLLTDLLLTYLHTCHYCWPIPRLLWS